MSGTRSSSWMVLWFRSTCDCSKSKLRRRRLAISVSCREFIPSWASSGLAFYTVPLLFIDPAIGAPVWGIKFIVAPSANPEIYFPAGTEMVLQLTAAASIPAPNTNFLFPVTSLSPADQTDPEQVLQNSSPRAYMGKRASDVINVLLIGSRNQIDRAFYAAGWAEAQRKSPLSGTLLRKSDHESHLP
jgi:LssY C-terminus